MILTTNNNTLSIKSIDINKWREVIQNPLAETNLLSLYLTTEFLLKTIHRYGINEITFAGLDINSIQVEHLATCLRATSKWRNEIDGWGIALEQAKEICKLKDIEPSDLLFGLI